MTRITIGLAAAVILNLSGCIAPVGPVEVTRFTASGAAQLGKGTISVEPAPAIDAAGPEWQAYRAAVARQLIVLGYTEAAPGAGTQVALVTVSRRTVTPPRSSPVVIGVGGATGSYGGALGVGVGLDLTPRSGSQVATDLAVTIKHRQTNATLWEGRASFVVPARSPLASTALGAPKVSEALFRGFPGQSGQTIEVR